MAEISLNVLLSGIVEALEGGLSDSAQIHTDMPADGLAAGDFLVSIKSSSRTSLGRVSYKQSTVCTVLYAPKTGQRDVCSMADQLFELLELVPMSSWGDLRGAEMGAEILPDGLHFKVSYSYSVRCEDLQTKMEDMLFAEEGGL